MVVKEFVAYRCNIMDRVKSTALPWKNVGTKTDKVVYYPNNDENFISKSIEIIYFIKQDRFAKIVARKIKVLTTKEIFKKYIDDSELFKESLKWMYS